MKKPKIPKLKSDKAAADFIDQDLSGIDFKQFHPTRFEFEKKDARLNMRVPAKMLVELKRRAKARGIPYQRLIREALEKAMEEKR